MGDRLGRMEALVDLLVKKAGTGSNLSQEMSARQTSRPGILTPDASEAASPSALFSREFDVSHPVFIQADTHRV